MRNKPSLDKEGELLGPRGWLSPEAMNKYLSEKVDNILIRVPKGKKAEIQDAAKQKSVSLNQYIVDAIDNALNQDRENNV